MAAEPLYDLVEALPASAAEPDVGASYTSPTRLRKAARLLALALACVSAVAMLSMAFGPAAFRKVNSQGFIGASAASDSCSYLTFPVAHTIQANAIADGSSIYPNYATNSEMNWGLDMAGLWWMMGNQLAEEFVSWKGATSTSPNVFPMTMSAPSNLKGNWVWPASIPGRVLMSYYAITEKPTVPQIATWTNATYATIVPIAGGSTSDSGFQYVLRKNMSDPSGDTWIRENLDHPGDTTPEYIYTLVRVVNGDGTPNAKWWPKFEDYAQNLGITTLQIWGNDDECRRKCESAGGLCGFCKWWCGS